MFVVVFFVLVILIVVYRYYDQDRKYWSRRGIPGPSPALFFGNLIQVSERFRPRSLVLRDWSEKYGKMYGISEGRRKYLVLSDYEMVTEMLTKKFAQFHGRAKMPLQDVVQGPRTNIIEAWGAQWKRLRALGTPAFSNNSLKKVRPTIEHSAHLMLDFLEVAATKGEVNVVDFFQEYTMGIICKLALGKKDIKMFANPYRDAVNGIFSQTLTSPIQAVPCLFPSARDPWHHLLDVVGNLCGVVHIRLLNDLRAHVAQRKKERANGDTNDYSDFIDMLLDAEVGQEEIDYDAEGREISRKLAFEEVVQQCFIFLLAGYETTATSLSYVTHFLANHPQIQAKMTEEIDAVCTDEEISFEQLAELRYTECVIKETLRHFPLASFVVTRECMESTQLGDVAIERGTSIYTDTWTIHMDTRLWGEDAREFRPERWLDGSLTAPRAAFQGFGEGPRMCLGMRLAFMEEKVALAHLLRRFSIRTTEKTNPLRLMGCFTVYPEQVIVRVDKR